MGFVAYLIIFAVAFAAASAFAPAAAVPVPASLEDFNFPTAEPGRPVPVIYGTVLMRAPNVVWYGDLSNQPVKASGGK